MTVIMSAFISCMGFLSLLLLLSMSQYNLFTWVNPTNVHKTLMEMFHHNNSKTSSPASGGEDARIWAIWVPSPSLQEPGELTERDWWRSILEVLRIHKIKRWTMEEEGLLDHVWEKFKILFRHTYPAKAMQAVANNKGRTKITPSSKISSGCIWPWFIAFVIACIWKVRQCKVK